MSVSVRALRGLKSTILLINYFKNEKAPTENKASQGFYQFTNPDKKDEIIYVKRKGQDQGQKNQRATWSWNQNQKWTQNQGDQKGQKGQEWKKERPIVRFVANQVIKLISAGGTISSNKDLRVSNHHRTQGTFLQYLRVSSRSTHSDSTTRSASWFSRSTTCSSTTSTAESKSSIHPLWVSVFWSVSLWPSRRI